MCFGDPSRRGSVNACSAASMFAFRRLSMRSWAFLPSELDPALRGDGGAVACGKGTASACAPSVSSVPKNLPGYRSRLAFGNKRR